MKKIVVADYMEFDDPYNKLGNYHYSKEFSKNGYEVLWMSCLYNGLLKIKHPQVYLKRKLMSEAKRHMLDENIYGFAVKSSRLYGKYPFCKNPNIVLQNEKYIKGDIKGEFRKIDFLDVDVLWISNPKQYWLTNVINYKKLIFRIPDDFVEFGAFPKGIEIIERELIQKADIIFVTAEKLKKRVIEQGKEALLLPNGCEIKHFLESKNAYPEEFSRDRKKIVYVGAIGEWFNIELVKKLALEISECDIYIIGKPQIDMQQLSMITNVKLLGAKPYNDIPNYIKNSDLAIIPFINNEFTDRINPIKLFEYLACGKPVLTTNMKEVERLNSPAYIAKNDKDFVDKAKQILKKNICDKNEYIEFAKKNSWDARYRYITQCIYNSNREK